MISLVCEEKDTGKKCQFKGISVRLQKDVCSSSNSVRFLDLIESNICLHYFLENCIIFLPQEHSVDSMLGLYPSNEISTSYISFPASANMDHAEHMLRLRFEKIAQKKIPMKASPLPAEAIELEEEGILLTSEEEVEGKEAEVKESEVNIVEPVSQEVKAARQPSAAGMKVEVEQLDEDQIKLEAEEEEEQEEQQVNDLHTPSKTEYDQEKRKEEYIAPSSSPFLVSVSVQAVGDNSLPACEASALNKKRRQHEVEPLRGGSETNSYNMVVGLDEASSPPAQSQGTQSNTDITSPTKLLKSECSPVPATTTVAATAVEEAEKANDILQSLLTPLDSSLNALSPLIPAESTQSPKKIPLSQFSFGQVQTINNNNNNNSSSSSSINRQSRNKERTIKEAIDMVTRWRDLQEDYRQKHQVKGLQEVADELNISKKVLDYYFQELRTAEFFGFDFNENLGNKMGVLRKFIEEQKKAHEDKNKNFKITRNLQFRYRLRDYTPGSTYNQTNAERLLHLQQQLSQGISLDETYPSPHSMKIAKDSKIAQKSQAKKEHLASSSSSDQLQLQQLQDENQVCSQFQDVLLKNSPIFLHYLNSNHLTANGQNASPRSSATAAQLTSSKQPPRASDQSNSIEKALLLFELFTNNTHNSAPSAFPLHRSESVPTAEKPSNSLENILTLMQLINAGGGGASPSTEFTPSSSLFALPERNSFSTTAATAAPPLLQKSHSTSDSRKSFTRHLKLNENVQVRKLDE